MRVKQPKPGQIGDYWLSKKPGRTRPQDPWCRTWYDASARQTRHYSLGTEDFRKASEMLAEWVIKNTRPVNARPDELSIEKALLDYWEDHGKNVASPRSLRAELDKWSRYWKGKTVSEITSPEQKKFRIFLGEGRLTHASVDRALSAGRAALNHAVRHGSLAAAPHIFMIETDEERSSRPPMGSPIEVVDIARFFKAVEHPHLLKFLFIASNTLARSEAIYDLRRQQFDHSRARLNLNPAGRKQTKKYRPIIPVTATLEPWLLTEDDPMSHYIAKDGVHIEDLRTVWINTVERAGLTGKKITPYSFRHGMARHVRARGISTSDLGLFMGHKHQGADRTTIIYAPDDPAYLNHVALAIDEVMQDVQAIAGIANWENPSAWLAGLDYAKGDARNRKGHLSLGDREELHQLLKTSGETPSELAVKFNVSLTSIYKHMRKLGIPARRN